MKFLYCRPFGVELEYNAFDGKAVTPKNFLPKGIHYVANLLSKVLEEYVEIREQGHTHWRKTYGYWVLKADNSCGIEVCSSVLQGWYGLKNICRVIDVFKQDPLINANDNCSLHLHVDVSDLPEEQIGNILRCWIKCEPVFFDSIPESRKNNRYCQFIGLWDFLDHDISVSTPKLIRMLGEVKYQSINTFHLLAEQRSTLEFRLGESALCKNSFFTKNWIRLLIHFMETARHISCDSLAWWDVKDIFAMMGFLRNDLSEGMQQVRNWFLGRLAYNSLDGFLSEVRGITRKQVGELLKEIPGFDLRQSLYPDNYVEMVYNKIYSV